MPRKRQQPGPGAPHLVANVAELRALAHPLRLRILELFAEAPRTTKQVAEMLGEPPTRLYHHVAALERAGLLRLRETRKNRGTTEKWFEAITRTMGTGTSVAAAKTATKKDVAARRAVAMTLLEQSRQEVLAAMLARAGEPPMLARLVFVAPQERQEELRARLYVVLKEIQAEFACEDEGEITDDYERWAMTLTLAPVAGAGAQRASR